MIRSAQLRLDLAEYVAASILRTFEPLTPALAPAPLQARWQAQFGTSGPVASAIGTLASPPEPEHELDWWDALETLLEQANPEATVLELAERWVGDTLDRLGTLSPWENPAPEGYRSLHTLPQGGNDPTIGRRQAQIQLRRRLEIARKRLRGQIRLARRYGGASGWSSVSELAQEPEPIPSVSESILEDDPIAEPRGWSPLSHTLFVHTPNRDGMGLCAVDRVEVVQLGSENHQILLEVSLSLNPLAPLEVEEPQRAVEAALGGLQAMVRNREPLRVGLSFQPPWGGWELIRAHTQPRGFGTVRGLRVSADSREVTLELLLDQAQELKLEQDFDQIQTGFSQLVLLYDLRPAESVA